MRLPAWGLRREYRSTFRGRLAGTERVVAGKFVGRVQPGTAVAPISVEEGLARDMQLKLGDEIDWDVQGVPLRTAWLKPARGGVAASGAQLLRCVSRGRPGGRAQGPRRRRARGGAGRVGRDPAGRRSPRFPTSPRSTWRSSCETVDGIFGKVEFAIDFMALFTVATGLVILAGTVFNGRYQRQRETVLLRTLGASRGQIGLIRIVEYAALGALGAGVGAVLALAAGALLARAVFHLPAAAPPLVIAGAVLASAALTVVTGWLADRSLLAGAPLEGLRGQGL